MTEIFADPSSDVHYWARFLMQVFIILVLVRVMGWLLALIKQPPVSKDYMEDNDHINGRCVSSRSLGKLLLV